MYTCICIYYDIFLQSQLPDHWGGVNVLGFFFLEVGWYIFNYLPHITR